MALEPSRYRVTGMVRPPQGFYASPELTKEEWDSWIRQMPEIRIYFAPREGRRGLDEFFAEPEDDGVFPVANVGFSDQDAVSADDGWALRGRIAVLRQFGIDTPMFTYEYIPTINERGVYDFDRVSTRGRSSVGFFADESACDEDNFVCFEEVVPKLFTIRLDRTYGHDTSRFALSALTPGLAPLTPRFERSSDIGNGGPWFFSDCDFSDEGAADRVDGGDKMLADRLYILDPGILAPMMRGISFSDLDRVGLPTFTAEVQIDLGLHESKNIMFSDDCVADMDYVGVEDLSHRERALRAVVAAKALRDTVLVSFAPQRPMQLGDYMPADAQYDDWIAEPL
jgi:hypothetical protein